MNREFAEGKELAGIPQEKVNEFLWPVAITGSIPACLTIHDDHGHSLAIRVEVPVWPPQSAVRLLDRQSLAVAGVMTHQKHEAL